MWPFKPVRDVVLNLISKNAQEWEPILYCEGFRHGKWKLYYHTNWTAVYYDDGKLMMTTKEMKVITRYVKGLLKYQRSLKNQREIVEQAALLVKIRNDL